MKKILVITTGIPHPSRGASRVLFYHYINAMSSTGCSILHLVIDLERETAEEELEEYRTAIGDQRDFRVMRDVVDRFHWLSRRNSAIETGMPSANVTAEVHDFKPDVTVCFDIVSGGIARGMGIDNPFIWLGDLAYEVGFFHAIYDAMANPVSIFKIPRAMLGCFFWKRFYRKILNGQTRVIVASKSSEEPIRKLGAVGKYLPYPWPGEDSVNAPQRRSSEPSFIMFGTLAALGSKSAFHFLLRKVYPLLVKQWGENGFRILIAGSLKIPEWADHEIAARPEIEFVGFIDDLAAAVGECHAVLAPISVPVGNRSRIITAMSMGSVVIAHKNTGLGNPELTSGENCFLAESASEFAGFMRRVYESPEEADEIRVAARARYLEKFEPDVACGLFLRELGL